MNSTVITGNLVRDPELRSTASGTAVANFSVADNRRWADPATGERREATTFVDVVAWGDLGRHVVESLRQGDRVTVSGRLEQRSWQTDQGERRSKLELTAADVAASLRWAAVGILKAEHGAELSRDQDFDYDLAEEGEPRLSTLSPDKPGPAVPLSKERLWPGGRWRRPPSSRSLPDGGVAQRSPPATSAGDPDGLRRRTSARRRAFFHLNVVGSHRALLGEGERLARGLAERRRRRLVIAADNRVAACPDLSR